MLAGGCKTSDDAKAAAFQLSITASALSDYYAALDNMLYKTDDLYKVKAIITPAAEYSPEAKQGIAKSREEIAKRRALASELKNVAAGFAQLTQSTAAADVSASATKLESVVEGIQGSSFKMDSSQIAIMQQALQALVRLVQERKEREAARELDKFTRSLATWFASEEPACNSIGIDYAHQSAAVARALLRRGQADYSQYVQVAMGPYGLTPQITDSALRDGLRTLAEEQIATREGHIIAQQQNVSLDIELALKEMAERIDLVANDKPMSFRLPPLTIDNVKKWVDQFTPPSAPATAPATPAPAASK
jgi:hypothetical protein